VACLDIKMPNLSGMDLLKAFKQSRPDVEVIMMTAFATVETAVEAVKGGAYDYLTKPFAFSELLARIQALIRRATQATEPTKLTVGDLSMDLLTREVQRGGEKIELQPREFALLEYLMRNAGRVVSKTMILSHVWEYNFDPQTNIVESRICKLRDKVDRGFERKLIHTLRGVGYKVE